MIRAVVYRLIGHPPPREAGREASLRWVRRLYWLMLGAMVLAFVLVALNGLTIVFDVVAAIAFGIWLQGFVSLTLRIRRARADPSGA